MRVYWKTLAAYGLVFWILLCIIDFLGITNVYRYAENLDDLYEKPSISEPQKAIMQPEDDSGYLSSKLGWLTSMWNSITFVCSVVVCFLGQFIACSSWKFIHTYRNRLMSGQLRNSNYQFDRGLGALSKIPVMIKLNQVNARSSDTNLKNTSKEGESAINSEKSCPNLLMKRSGSSLSNIVNKACKTIYKNDTFHGIQADLSLTIQQLEKQCKKYKEELLKLQTASLKEHAALSRKLEALNKEKKDVAKQLALVQKENRAAKQQLEELLQDKATLIKKLENATKEFKTNTKTKKVALAKLEEVTSNVELLQSQLEQVSRDKEILEKKLRLLETEYNKLHERYIASQQRSFSPIDENMPERDKNNEAYYQDSGHNGIEAPFHDCCSLPQNALNAMASVSQTEMDMKKIQHKIKQLEKNLENLHVSSNDMVQRMDAQGESELSLSTMTDSNRQEDEDTVSYNESGYSQNNSPRRRQWAAHIAELGGLNSCKFARIQAILAQMQEKARYLENIREHEIEGDTTDFSSIDGREPRRIVSSSVAFKNFLKSLSTMRQLE